MAINTYSWAHNASSGGTISAATTTPTLSANANLAPTANLSVSANTKVNTVIETKDIHVTSGNTLTIGSGTDGGGMIFQGGSFWLQDAGSVNSGLTSGELFLYVPGSETFTSTPGITSFTLNGANVVMTATDGQANAAYYLLASPNLSLPINQWHTVATNVPGASGSFTFTGTNVVTRGDAQQFYIL